MKGEKENKNEKDAYNLNSCNNNTVNLNNANIGADISNVNVIPLIKLQNFLMKF